MLGAGGVSNAYLRAAGGVLLHNWAEERFAAAAPPPPAAQLTSATAAREMQMQAPGRLWLHARRRGRRAAAPDAHPAQPPASRCAPGALGTSHTAHGEPGEAPACYWATLNSLAYGEKFLGMPRVQEFLFTGKNRADAKVPVGPPGLAAGAAPAGLAATKRDGWRAEGAADPWATTSRGALQEAALAAAAAGWGAAAARPGGARGGGR
ncbi:MAG: hypothetical protein J3K34DRAFT_502353 [Monoraphidium minutum]|nr:MAG: hypothetical protein J3K34DRAFT_502353 [Monoraphidium minutum]